MYYYVIIEVLPDDCMGNRAKAIEFLDYREAVKCYNEYFCDPDKTKKEFFDLLLGEGINPYEDYDDENDEELSTLNVFVDFEIVKLNNCFFDIPEIKNAYEKPQNDTWLNDYDGLSINGVGEYCNYYDLFCVLGAETITGYSTEFHYTYKDEY